MVPGGGRNGGQRRSKQKGKRDGGRKSEREGKKGKGKQRNLGGSSWKQVTVLFVLVTVFCDAAIYAVESVTVFLIFGTLFFGTMAIWA